MGKSSIKTNLEEGKYYPFRISGSVILPDGSECYILTDINEVKHLLYKQYYKRYNFGLNDEIRCRIDKINCTGKIYIEPEHPYYKLGDKYNFTFDRYILSENPDGENESLAILRNGIEEDIYLAADEIEKPLKQGETLEAIVERIKRGRVYITVGSSINDYTGMEPGKKYRFTLINQIWTGGNYEYYILADENKKEFRIRKKFYSKYGFKIGDQVSCELKETDHQVYLEPVHPHYEVGFNYEFLIIGETLIDEYPARKEKAWVLEHKYGKDIILKKEDVLPERIKENLIKCTVVNIKKSQVSLACQ